MKRLRTKDLTAGVSWVNPVLASDILRGIPGLLYRVNREPYLYK